jgi:hypothetical protein
MGVQGSQYFRLRCCVGTQPKDGEVSLIADRERAFAELLDHRHELFRRLQAEAANGDCKRDGTAPASGFKYAQLAVNLPNSGVEHPASESPRCPELLVFEVESDCVEDFYILLV